MGFVEKLKNALFEVEYVVDDPTDKQDKKTKEKNDEKKDNEKDKPIAKKVILTGHKKNTTPPVVEPRGDEVKLDNINEPMQQPVTEEKVNEFKVMNDNDFKVEDDYKEEDVQIERPEPTPVYHDDYREPISNVDDRVIYRQEVREKTPYGIDTTSRNLVQEYGRAYEKKEENKGFKPSPIISPIYGVLDKNYKKEDVKEKKDVRLTTYSRESINVDEVRNKAYGEKEHPVEKEEEKKETFNRVVEKEKEKSKPVFVEEDDDDEDLLVDLSKDDDKLSIKEVTMGDALEYFQDLGLEYNVDYVDASKERATGRRVKDNYDEQPELFAIQDSEEKKEESVDMEVVKSTKNDDIFLNKENEKVDNNSEEPKDSEEIDVENDDNLFDLIDSMYDEEK